MNGPGMNDLGAWYIWLTAAHLIFVIYWMAGLFILPRHLIYHQEALADGRITEAALWVTREDKLRKIILTPAMIAVIGLGIALATIGHHWGEAWLHAKLAFVVLLAAYHGYMVGYSRKLERGAPTLTGGRLRLLNEVPGVAVIAIVILAIVKPF